jgi:hypothetical protein
MLSCAENIYKRLLSKTHAEKIFSQNALLYDWPRSDQTLICRDSADWSDMKRDLNFFSHKAR